MGYELSRDSSINKETATGYVAEVEWGNLKRDYLFSRERKTAELTKDCNPYTPGRVGWM
jgi:hypothetical protein